jgi:hypothetical protein
MTDKINERKNQLLQIARGEAPAVATVPTRAAYGVYYKKYIKVLDAYGNQCSTALIYHQGKKREDLMARALYTPSSEGPKPFIYVGWALFEKTGDSWTPVEAAPSLKELVPLVGTFLGEIPIEWKDKEVTIIQSM